jgi:hypothetical protein
LKREERRKQTTWQKAECFVLKRGFCYYKGRVEMGCRRQKEKEEEERAREREREGRREDGCKRREQEEGRKFEREGRKGQ